MKKCKHCGSEFQPFRSLQRVCSPKCAVDLVREESKAKRKKEAKREIRQKKKDIKSRSDWMKEAQQAFNRFIRARDKDLPCISCGRHHQGQYHAGHYRSVGANPELRFALFNNNKQCSACNTHLSGNLINYRINLLDRVGADVVEWLEGPHDPKKYTIDELIEIKQGFNAWARELEK